MTTALSIILAIACVGMIFAILHQSVRFELEMLEEAKRAKAADKDRA